MSMIVTGSASGIGRATASALAAQSLRYGEPANLLLVDRTADALEDAAAEVRAVGAAVETCVEDLTDVTAPARVAALAKERFGGVDVLVSNAGMATPGTLLELSLDDYEATFALNTRATWLLAKACHPMLRESRGALVATASVSAEEPTSPLGVYSASKSALVMLVRQLAYEWGPDGIRCNCVSPGAVHTGLTDAVYGNPAERERRAANIPIRRIGMPEDIAAAIAFLAGPEAAYITGANLTVDGGLTNAFMPLSRGRDTL